MLNDAIGLNLRCSLMSSSVRWCTSRRPPNPTPPTMISSVAIARNRSIAWTEHAPAPTRLGGRVNQASALLFLGQAQQIAPEFLGVEAHAEVLHPQAPAPIDNRGEESVVDVAFSAFAANTP